MSMAACRLPAVNAWCWDCARLRLGGESSLSVTSRFGWEPTWAISTSSSGGCCVEGGGLDCAELGVAVLDCWWVVAVSFCSLAAVWAAALKEQEFAPALWPSSPQLAHLGLVGVLPFGQLRSVVSECSCLPHERQRQEVMGVMQCASSWPYWQQRKQKGSGV